MPKHLAIDVNVVSGTVSLHNTKTARILYKDANGNQVLFQKAPRLGLTLLNTDNSPAAKTENIKSGDFYAGCDVGFPQKVTLDVEWQATERE